MAKAIVEIVAALLPYLLDWIDEAIKARRRKKRQEKRDALHKDPGAWAADHFGGKLHDVDSKPRAK